MWLWGGKWRCTEVKHQVGIRSLTLPFAVTTEEPLGNDRVPWWGRMSQAFGITRGLKVPMHLDTCGWFIASFPPSRSLAHRSLYRGFLCPPHHKPLSPGGFDMFTAKDGLDRQRCWDLIFWDDTFLKNSQSSFPLGV